MEGTMTDNTLAYIAAIWFFAILVAMFNSNKDNQ